MNAEGTNACVQGQFAQCVNGAYTLQSCSSGLSCFALPLVNKAGTSVTCTTEADAAARIAATGVSGGVTGSGDNSTSSTGTSSSASASDASASDVATQTANTAVAVATSAAATTSAASSSASSSSGSGFLLSNGQKAQQQNAQFATLTTDDSCDGVSPALLVVFPD